MLLEIIVFLIVAIAGGFFAIKYVAIKFVQGLLSKENFIQFLKLLKNLIIDAIKNGLDLRQLAHQLLDQASPSSVLKIVNKIKKLFSGFDTQSIKDIIGGAQAPSFVLIILRKQLQIALDQYNIDQKHLIKLFEAYEQDGDIRNFRQQAKAIIVEILEEKIDESLPRIPDFLNKDKILHVSKKMMKSKCQQQIQQYKRKFGDFKGDLKQFGSKFKIFASNAPQQQDKTNSVLINQGIQSIDSSKPIQTFNGAILRYKNDKDLQNNLEKLQNQAQKIMNRYRQKIQKGTLTMDDINEMEKLLNYW